MIRVGHRRRSFDQPRQKLARPLGELTVSVDSPYSQETRMPGTSTSHLDWLLRFRRLDDALASADGLNIPAFADTEGISERSVWRDLETMNAAGISTDYRRVEETGRYTHHNTHRLFAQ